VWGNSHTTHLHKIVLLQKKAIRLVCNANAFEHVAPLAKSVNLLLFEDVYKMKVCKLMHLIFYTRNYAKYALTRDLFIFAHKPVNLRHVKLDFPMPYCRTTCRKRSIFVNGISILNSLSVSFKEEPNIKKCKYCV
jgi:hypothetical protein